MTVIQLLCVLALLVTALAAVIDWRKGLIPNWLTLPLLVLGVVVHVGAFRMASPEVDLSRWLFQSLGGVALCGLVPFILWKRDAMGGGDLKLLAALGGLLGPMIGIEAQLYAFVAALFVAPIKLTYEGKLMNVIGNSLRVLANPFLPKSKQQKIPQELMSEFRFGPAVFLGVLAASVTRWGAGSF